MEVKKQAFSEKHPIINSILAVVILLVMIVFAIIIIKYIIQFIGVGIASILTYIKDIVKNTDKVVVVALVTGFLSLFGILVSSTLGRIYEYRYNVKKYQYEKKEDAYEDFINIYYGILDKARKNQPIDGEDTIIQLNEFSKKLTLWGSNEVIKKWLKFRLNSVNEVENPRDILLILEDILFAIRKDLGNRNKITRKLKHGDLLSFVINDISSHLKK